MPVSMEGPVKSVVALLTKFALISRTYPAVSVANITEKNLMLLRRASTLSSLYLIVAVSV